MTSENQKVQIIRTPGQWNGGLFHRLELRDEKVQLYSVVTFSHWMNQPSAFKNAGALAIDECGQIYFYKKEDGTFYLFDPKFGRLEPIIWGKLSEAIRIILGDSTIWIASKKKIRGFSKHDFQLKYVIDASSFRCSPSDFEILDFSSHSDQYLYILEKSLKRIYKWSVTGGYAASPAGYLKEPVSISLGKQNQIYVIDASFDCILQYETELKEEPVCIGKLPEDFHAVAMAVDHSGNIFVAQQSGIILQFDPDGSKLAEIIIPNFTGTINHITAHPSKGLYVSTSQGIAVLTTGDKISKEAGAYYSRTLDSGTQQLRWHKISLKADLPPRTLVHVYYSSSNETALKRFVDNTLDDAALSTEQKKDILEKHLSWKEPETFSSSNESPAKVVNTADRIPELKSILIRQETQRYLWLKVVLSSYDESATPSISEIKVYYPRISYLRYLPATYQEDPASKDFLERFLSIFESAFCDTETEIAQLSRYLDTSKMSAGFLKYVASWLNLALEEEWPEQKKRKLLEMAPDLFKRKGTPAGISALVEIYTGTRPFILEHSRSGTPIIMNGNSRLGVNSLLLGTPVRGFRLGDDSIVGLVALRNIVQAPDEVFLSVAHRFTVILNISAEQFSQYQKGLIRILDAEKPAHTAYTLRIVSETKLGMGAYVGISTLADFPPGQLGAGATIGSVVVVRKGEQAGRVEQQSKLEIDTNLI